jgi:UbiD family decarboxylase
MDLRELMGELKASGELVVIERPVDRRLEMARAIRALGNRPVLFARVQGSDTPVLANLCARR